MWTLLMKSRKFREMFIALIAAILVLVAGLALPHSWAAQPETQEQIRQIAGLVAGLIVAAASAHVLGIAIEDAGEKASGRSPAPPAADPDFAPAKRRPPNLTLKP